MIYCFDIDGTICTPVKDSKYENAKPFMDVIREINRLHSTGNKIIIMTARGSVSGKDWTIKTITQLSLWGVQYDRLIMNQKPHADIFVDDKAINIKDYRKAINAKIRKGIIAGAFDILHPGYIAIFKEAKKYCDHFIVALHADPSIQNNNKMSPILSSRERTEILSAISFVDEIIDYKSEEDLYELLKEINPDVRFLGDDYRDKKIMGEDLKIPIHFIDRSHGWSATKFKNMIKEV